MKKAMLSQPMAGKSEAEIIATRDKAIRALKEREYEVVNTLFTDEWYSDKAMKEVWSISRYASLPSRWRI